MKEIKLKDLELVVKKKATYPIIRYDSNGNETYYENSNGDWRKYKNNKKIEYRNNKYYVNNVEYKLKENTEK